MVTHDTVKLFLQTGATKEKIKIRREKGFSANKVMSILVPILKSYGLTNKKDNKSIEYISEHFDHIWDIKTLSNAISKYNNPETE